MRTAIIFVAVIALLFVAKSSADDYVNDDVNDDVDDADDASCSCPVTDKSEVQVCDTEGTEYPSLCELKCDGKTQDTTKKYNTKTGNCE